MGIYEAYEQYYSTRLYDRRYPRPNGRTLATLRRHLPAGSTVIDFGAGNGRYALPLAAMGHHVVAVEPSEAGRARIAERVAEASGAERDRGGAGVAERIELHADLSEVAPRTLAEASAVMPLFGVLGHLTYADRTSILSTFSQAMRPGARLLGSVPNRFRRFRREQRESSVDDDGASPRVQYRRGSGGDALQLELTLFSPAEIKAELTAAGWRCERLTAESVLPEAAVTARQWVGTLDAVASSIVPSAIGYCIFFVASNSQAAAAPAARSRTAEPANG